MSRLQFDEKTIKLAFEEGPLNGARIKVIGIGGGGCNAVMRMLKAKPIPGVNYFCVNTDIKSLQLARRATQIQIGETLTRGMGAGGDPEVGVRCVEDDHMLPRGELSLGVCVQHDQIPRRGVTRHLGGGVDRQINPRV